MQKTEIVNKVEKDGWIYTLRKMFTCGKPNCTCHSGKYHDYQYVFEKRKYTTNPAKSLGNVNDIGFPPKIIQHRLSDEEEARLIYEKVDFFINSLKTDLNGTYSQFTEADWEILAEKYSNFLKIRQQTGKTIRKLFNRGKKDTTDLMRKSYLAMRELEDSLNRTKKHAKIIANELSSTTNEYSNKNSNYDELLQQV